MSRFVLSLTITLSALLFASDVLAQQTANTTTTASVPNLIRYGGTLKDAQGGLVASATMGVTFAIYKQQEGGAAIWMETQNVTTDPNGNYSEWDVSLRQGTPAEMNPYEGGLGAGLDCDLTP